ncbi:MAG TPA: hypothetical protein V6D05_10475 [Stenomitos sp.]
MRRTRAASTLVLALALIGCQETAPSGPHQNRLEPDTSASGKPKFMASPTPAPSGPPGVPSDWPTRVGTAGTFSEDFEGAAANLADWKDPKADDGHTQSWLYSGTWNIVPAVVGRAPGTLAPRSTGTRALEHNDMRPQPALSFRRYAGTAFGTPDGELPNRYSVQLQVTPLNSRDDFFPPIGDQGTPVYYLDPQHYVEVLIKPDKFEVWECNGGEPTKWRGWKPLFQEDATHSARVTYSLGAEVDATTGTIRVYKNGAFRREVKSDIVKPYTHYFALRAGSNQVQFDNIVINGY